MTVDGRYCPLRTSEPRTSAADGGYWPTPTVNGNYNRKGASADSGDGLITAIRNSMFPTPTANDAKNASLPPASANWDSLPGHVLRGLQSHGINVVSGGLNPPWVEWLMGYPGEWTVCAAWAMQSSRRRRKPPSGI
jgi:DNA (cytosine-5)-methyltransferase 1